jgi:hypothetical protein
VQTRRAPTTAQTPHIVADAEEVTGHAVLFAQEYGAALELPRFFGAVTADRSQLEPDVRVLPVDLRYFARKLDLVVRIERDGMVSPGG